MADGLHVDCPNDRRHPPLDYTTTQWSNGRMRYLSLTLSEADLLDVSGTPIELIPDPGAGKMILLMNGYAFLDYGTGAYTAANHIQLRYDGGDHTMYLDSTLLEEGADKYESVKFNTGQEMLKNKKIEVYSESNPTLGTGDTGGTLTIHIWYTVNDV